MEFLDEQERYEAGTIPRDLGDIALSLTEEEQEESWETSE